MVVKRGAVGMMKSCVAKTTSSLPRRTKTWIAHHPGVGTSRVAAWSSLFLARARVARITNSGLVPPTGRNTRFTIASRITPPVVRS
jgi:hypothetical protein